MQNKIRFSIYCTVAVILMALVVRPAVVNNVTLLTGTVHKFNMRPVDPEDPFRGRYVALDFAQRSAPIRANEDSLTLPKKLFAILTVDTAGFTLVEQLQREKPADGEYITVDITHRNWGDTVSSTWNVAFDFPFTQFYMTEKLAPIAEVIYRREVRETNSDSYLAVRILNGHAVIEELYLNGIPISDAARDESKK